MPDDRAPAHRIRLRYPATCRTCTTPIARGEWACYDRQARQAECLACAADECATSRNNASPATEQLGAGDDNTTRAEVVDDRPEQVDGGTAGASAQREHERRVARREQRVRQSHPRLGGLILALIDDPQSTRAWATGARGEERVGQLLDNLADQGVRALHDRRIPGTRANIDHIAIGPAGVFVIDTKRYNGRPHLRVEGGFLRPRVEKLIVGGRDRTKLVDGVIKQAALVRAAITSGTTDDGSAAIDVRAMLCFIDADWPLIGGAFTISGVRVLWPKLAVKVITEGNQLDTGRIDQLHRALTSAFPPA